MRRTPPTLILIGLRGSGKSTLGAGVARALSLEFIDLDVHTARALQCTNAGDALRMHGESAFRAAEAAALRSILSPGNVESPGRRERRPLVLALGGGTAMIEEVRTLLTRERTEGAMIVYLRAMPHTHCERLRRTRLSDRPSLTGAGVLEEVRAIFEARDGVYRSLATHTIDTDGMDEAEALARVLRHIENA